MQRKQEQGFALIVVSALFIAFALVATVFIDRTNALQQINQQDQMRAQLTRLSLAITHYYLDHDGIYPCPADVTVLFVDRHYGESVNCTLTSPPGITTLNDPLNSHEVVEGMVPVAELVAYGITPDDASDLWNNRVMYVVNSKLTVKNGSNPTVLPTVTEPRIGVTYKPPEFIVLSYGRDGLGAINKNAAAPINACLVGPEKRTANCDGDINFIQLPLLTGTGVAVEDYFDDLLSFQG